MNKNYVMIFRLSQSSLAIGIIDVYLHLIEIYNIVLPIISKLTLCDCQRLVKSWRLCFQYLCRRMDRNKFGYAHCYDILTFLHMMCVVLYHLSHIFFEIFPVKSC